MSATLAIAFILLFQHHHHAAATKPAVPQNPPAQTSQQPAPMEHDHGSMQMEPEHQHDDMAGMAGVGPSREKPGADPDLLRNHPTARVGRNFLVLVAFFG